MNKHGIIQKDLIDKYKREGYQTFEEASIINEEGSFYIADLIVKKGEEEIVFEIGNTTDTKLEFLRKKFKKVIHIPYTQSSLNGYIKHNLCGYMWRSRKSEPKECPRCKVRLDWK